MSRAPRSLLDGVVQTCLSLMVAAIALSVAVTVIRPYRDLLAVIALAVMSLVAWRAWQRNRW